MVFEELDVYPSLVFHRLRRIVPCFLIEVRLSLTLADERQTKTRGLAGFELKRSEQRMKEVQLAIVSGGHACLSVAVEATRLNVSSLIIDEKPQLDGQIYRQLAIAFRIDNEDGLGRQYRDGKRIFADVEEFHDKIDAGMTVSFGDISATKNCCYANPSF